MNPYYPPDLPFPLVRAWYEAFAERTSLPLFLFNTPYSGTALTVDQIVSWPRSTSCAGSRTRVGASTCSSCRQRIGDRIVVADAAERDWLNLHTKHGFQALMSTPALALYQTPGNLPIVEYTRAGGSCELEATVSLPPARVFEKWMRRPWLDGRVIPIAELKAWLELLGLPQGPVRAPLVPLSEERRRALADDLESLGLR